ncbi:tRNA-binding protein [Roseivirga ehrenbergii]|uniref:tRNA-binding protein n=1 Tax=Roseivirga ehrenbergii (strain DSM 102268 / JCM 13514 / KCTC 12282 / NCIMB 14502 / KMM 6017) TaxID=279360 RepID=A0A150XRN5_ROSEK|nr:tRNA-binding protein [Roseivirga ehrenbergii]KYG81373.1 tRNA-binding protein [Roseivirga ehrenbergii]TCL10515.1 tRNA-binding protein [Roseivirga ehrenbergii]
MNNLISWSDFEKVDVRVGTIIQVEDFEKARKPAWILHVDLGTDLGIKKSSAQIKHHYAKSDLLNTQVICVVNFPPKQIANIKSEILVTGFPDEDGNIILARPDKAVPNGAKLF